MVKKIFRSEFFKNVSYQMIGTTLGQFLPFLATPVITRLYSEENFALFTSFYAVASILVVGTGARYQLAILLPRKSSDATTLHSLSIYATVIFSVLLVIIFLLIGERFSGHLGNAIFFLPVYVLCFGLWNSYSYVSIREKTFFKNAFAKVLQAIVYVIVAICIGLLNMPTYGLIIARVAGILASALYLFQALPKIISTSTYRLKNIAKTYKDYPKYGIFPALLNVVSIQGIVIVLTKHYDFDDVGYFGLTYLVLTAPLSFIGASFKDVFHQKISSLMNKRAFNEAYNFFKLSALSLFSIGLIIALTTFFFGSSIFAIVFGEKWSRSGEFASIMSLSFLASMVSSPLSAVFAAVNRLNVASVWQTLYFITTCLTLGMAAIVLKVNVETLLIIYSIHEAVLYGIYFVLQQRTLKAFSVLTKT